MAKKIYRYITNGTALPGDPICNFRLITMKELNASKSKCTAVRVDVTGVKLTKYSCDNYATTEDTHTLEYHEYMPIIKINGGWVPRPKLIGTKPRDWHNTMQQEGWRTLMGKGFVTKEEYEEYFTQKQKHIGELKQLDDKLRTDFYAYEHELENLSKDDMLFLLKDIYMDAHLNHKKSKEK